MIRKDLYDICQEWLQDAGNINHKGFIVVRRKHEPNKVIMQIITNIPGALIGYRGDRAATYIAKLKAAELTPCDIEIIEADGIAY